MARTRKKAAIEPTATDAPPATDFAPDPQEEIVHGVVEQPHVEQPQASHAATVGKRTPRYNEQGITDKLAGARLLEHHDPFYSIIRFEEKPSDAVREKLREASFTWNTPNKEWAAPIRFDSRMQDRINAEEVFEDVCRVIRAERGIVHSFGGA